MPLKCPHPARFLSNGPTPSWTLAARAAEEDGVHGPKAVLWLGHFVLLARLHAHLQGASIFVMAASFRSMLMTCSRTMARGSLLDGESAGPIAAA